MVFPIIANTTAGSATFAGANRAQQSAARGCDMSAYRLQIRRDLRPSGALVWSCYVFGGCRACGLLQIAERLLLHGMMDHTLNGLACSCTA